MEKLNFSIRRKLILSIITIGVFPFLLLVIVLAFQTYNVQWDEVKKNQEELTKQAAKKLALYFYEQDQKILTVFGSSFFSKLARDKQKDILAQFLATSKDEIHGYIFQEVILTNEKGIGKVQISRSKYIDPNNQDYSNMDEYIFPFLNKEKYYGPVYFDDLTGAPLMNVGYPIIDINSLDVKGVLIIKVKMDNMAHLLVSMKIGETGGAFLTREDGKVVAYRGPSIINKKTFLKIPKTTSVMNGLNGQKSIVTASKVNLSGNSFYLVTEVPLYEAFSYLLDILYTIILLLLFSFFIALVLGVTLVRQIVTPIEQLALLANKVDREGMAYAEVERRDEIGILSIAFNTMTSNLLTMIKDLEKEKEFVKNVFSSVTSPFYVIDVKDYSVKIANSVAGFGKLTPESKCYKLTHNLNSPCSNKYHPCPIQLIKESRKPVVVEHDHENIDTKKKEKYEISAYPIFDENGELTEVIEYSVDITEKRKLEEEIRQNQKMESIGSLSGGIAHDFNNILSAIMGFSELILMEMKEDNPFRENIESIHEAGKSGANLTHQLLAFSRKQLLEIKIVNLNDIVKKMKKIINRLKGENLNFKQLLNENIGNVRVDSSQIEQVILNLAVNARDAMETGGTICIQTDRVDLEKEINDIPPGPYVMLIVSDDGCGFDDEVKEKIFEPFFTTKSLGNGTGLGLSTIYGIVKQLNAYICVESEVGEGTTFTIYFPESKEASKKKIHKPDKVKINGSETILVIDDEKLICKLVKDSLEHLGYKVIIAGNCNQVIDYCQDKDFKFDLLLTDVIMPVMNGKQLSEKVRILRPDVKILFMSGYLDEIVSSLAIVKSDFFFIRKPLSPVSLAKKIREILD